MENTKKIPMFKTKDLGEIAFLKMNNVDVLQEHTYDRKTIMFFDNRDKKSVNLIRKYYDDKYYDFFNSLQETRSYLFNKVNM